MKKGMVGHFHHHRTEERFARAEEDQMWWEGGKIKPNENKSKLKAVCNFFPVIGRYHLVLEKNGEARQRNDAVEWVDQNKQRKRNIKNQKSPAPSFGPTSISALV